MKFVGLLCFVASLGLWAQPRVVMFVGSGEQATLYETVLRKGLLERVGMELSVERLGEDGVAQVRAAVETGPAALILAGALTIEAAQAPPSPPVPTRGVPLPPMVLQPPRLAAVLKASEVPLVLLAPAVRSLPKGKEWRSLTGISAGAKGWAPAKQVRAQNTSSPLMPSAWHPHGTLANDVNLLSSWKVVAASEKAPVMWQREKPRRVATTLGADAQQLLQPACLDSVAYALLWCLDGLRENGLPKPGFGGNGETKTLTAFRQLMQLEKPVAAGGSEADAAVTPDTSGPVPAAGATVHAQVELLTGSSFRVEALRSFSGGAYATFAEIALVAEEGPPVLMADCKIRASSEQGPTQLAENLLDGDPGTNWHSRYINGRDSFPFVLTIKLPAEATIGEVRCTLHARNAADGISAFRLTALNEEGDEQGSTEGVFVSLQQKD